MPDRRKTRDLQPEANLPAASPKPNRSKIAEIEHLRRGVRPERLLTDDKSQPEDIASRDAATLETATRIAAEYIAQESLEKAKLAVEADRARLDLTRERDERQAAAIETDARLAAVNRDLANIHDAAAAIRKSLARERTIRIVAGLAAAVFIGVAVIYRLMSAIPALSVPSLTPSSPPRTAVLLPESQTALDSPEVRFVEGMDRLNDTLASAAGGNPAEAIRTVRSTLSPAVCPFVWRNGQVSLTFNEETNLSSLTNTLSKCADAVAQLH
ncbi:MAG: hypothetical protein ABSG41_06305 [Bryobacteraceae bacterium]